MTALWGRIGTSIRKKLRLGHSLGELDRDLAGKELVFRAPPLTPRLVGAIRRISPQFHLRPDELSRRFWELNQNGLCWGEYEALKPFLDRLGGPPGKVLDIGAGLGRSAIFFKQLPGWKTVPIHLYEGTGESTKYTKAGPRFDDSFCGDIETLETLLRFNQIEGYEIIDARQMGASLAGLRGPYDFVYSFFAVGFHWSIGHFLDEIRGLMSECALGAFTLHDRFTDFAELGEVPHRVVEFRSSWPRDRKWRMLIVSSAEELLGAAAPQ